MKKENISKIVVVVVILCLVVGVFFFKKNEENATSNQEDTSVATSELTQREKDFAMEIYDNELNIERLTSYGVPVIVDFSATWCQPCREFEPTLYELKELYGDDIIIKLLDVEKYQEIAMQFEFPVIPTQLFYNSDGTPFVPLTNMTNTNIQHKKDEDGNILYTTHTAASSLNKMKLYLNEMGLDNDEEINAIFNATPTPTVTISK